MAAEAVLRTVYGRVFGEMYGLLYAYNALVITLLSAFLCLTQYKIYTSMNAYAFLKQVEALPLPLVESCLLTALSFLLLVLFGGLYRMDRSDRRPHLYLLLMLEIAACMALMRGVNFAYDGVVLLVVADLMQRYEGHHRAYFLIGALVVLYLIANVNLALYQTKVIPFESYVAYYNSETQSILRALRSACSSLNTILFISYIVLLIRHKNEERARIRLLNEKLEEANQRLRAYAIHAAHMAETRERNRLAREIHDTLGHALTGITAGLDACMVTLDSSPAFTRAQLARIRDAAQHGITDVRRSMKKLRPDAMEKLPFQEAITAMTQDYAQTSGMEVSLDVQKWPANLREDQEDVIYRVLQESLTNAHRHGQAKHVHITIGEQTGMLCICIADDGVGCPKVIPGFGLRHMQERLCLLHGTAAYRSGAGFTVDVTIPLSGGGETV